MAALMYPWLQTVSDVAHFYIKVCTPNNALVSFSQRRWCPCRAMTPLCSDIGQVLPSNLPDWSIVVIPQNTASYDLNHINLFRFADDASTTRAMLYR